MRIRALSFALLVVSCGVAPSPDSELPPDLRPAQYSEGHPDGPLPPRGPVVVDQVALTTFTGAAACADLERHLEDRAALQMRLAVQTQKAYALQSWDWSHGAGGGWTSSGGGSGFADAGSSASGGAAGGGSGSSGPTDYTTTNTQVASVDEPDIIKNDGTRLFVVSGRKLFATTTWPANELRTRGAVALGGRPFELFLEGDRVVVFSHVYEPAFGGPSYCASSPAYCETSYPNATLITHLDVSNLDQLTVLATQRVPGRYEAARRVGDTMRLVTTGDLPFLSTLPTWLSWEEQRNTETREALALKYDTLAYFNEQLIRRQTLDTWFPGARLTAGAATATAPLDCTGIWTTNASARLGLTHITNLRMSDPLSFSRQSLLAAVDELYQGPDSLYLAQRHWWWWASGANANHTYLYRFDLSQPDHVNFVAAGRIDGTPLNQFSFDEHRGQLRVATTVTDTTTWNTRNKVVVLGTQGTALVQVGSTPDLAPGERIMSARFIGDRAYVVTFRQVDPLYVIDLSDGTQPRVLGELKIPGFSTYIHPLDGNHLLTIGTFIPEPPSPAWERQLQLQIFDVSDPTNPKQTHTQLVGRAWGWSEAQWNHKAFNYFPARGLLAVPFADWRSSDGTYEFTSDLRVFHVDATNGFTLKGALDMRDVLRRNDCNEYGCWNWYWEPAVRRSVMADDYVYAVSSGGVRVAHIDSLSTPLATAIFDPAP